MQDNAVLCNEVNEKVVQHFVHCIESHGKHVQYLRFLQTIVHTESQFIRRCQDLVMQVSLSSFFLLVISCSKYTVLYTRSLSMPARMSSYFTMTR